MEGLFILIGKKYKTVIIIILSSIFMFINYLTSKKSYLM